MKQSFESAINASVEHLFSQTLGLELSPAKSVGKGFFGASIPVKDAKGEWEFYLFFKPATLALLASELLGSDELSEVDTHDLCKELANLIIGQAKNLLNQTYPARFSLGTPEFLGQERSFGLKLEAKFIYKLKNRTFYIGYKYQ